MVIMSNTMNVKNPAATVSLVSFELYFTCMKNSTTSVIFRHAIASATTALNTPRSIYETAAVVAGQDQQRTANQEIHLWRDNVLFVMRRFVSMLCFRHNSSFAVLTATSCFSSLMSTD